MLDARWNQTPADRLAQAIGQSGLAVMRNMVPENLAHQLGEGVERAFAAFDAHHTDGKGTDWFTPFPSKTEDLGTMRDWVRHCGGVYAVDSPAMLGRLIDAYRELGIIDWVRDFLGEQPVLSSHKTTLRLTHPDTQRVPWHQDGSFLGEGARVLNIWLALTDCGEDAVGLDLSLRRQPGVVGAGEDGASYPWVNDARAEREAGEIVSPVLAPGDAVVFDHLCLHRTAAAPATKTRKAIEAWFFAPSTLPANYDGIPV
jgi:hypothetical protein